MPKPAISDTEFFVEPSNRGARVPSPGLEAVDDSRLTG